MKKIDNIFFTCCILQDMLHSYNGLGKLEGNTDWTGDAGLHDVFYSDPYTDLKQMGMPRDQGGEDIQAVGKSNTGQRVICQYNIESG
ncbi:unnamed protein product [Choristocarpus tenellus]